jgi:hypothetical protein
MPFGEVMTQFAPELATAQKSDNSGAQQTEFHALSNPEVLRVVQVIPSGEVITRFAVPELATAQNKERAGDHVTEFQALSLLVVSLAVHTMLSELVMTLSAVPELATAQKSVLSGAQHTEFHALLGAPLRVAQVPTARAAVA